VENRGLGFTWNYLANMVMHNPHFDLMKVTNEDIARGELHYAPIMDASDPDLSAFKAHGGKLIQYHGWNDPRIPPGYSLEYRARVAATMGKIDDFYRLYMVRGCFTAAAEMRRPMSIGRRQSRPGLKKARARRANRQ